MNFFYKIQTGEQKMLTVWQASCKTRADHLCMLNHNNQTMGTG